MTREEVFSELIGQLDNVEQACEECAVSDWEIRDENEKYRDERDTFERMLRLALSLEPAC